MSPWATWFLERGIQIGSFIRPPRANGKNHVRTAKGMTANFRLAQNLVDHSAADVGQTEVAALETMR